MQACLGLRLLPCLAWAGDEAEEEAEGEGGGEGNSYAWN